MLDQARDHREASTNNAHVCFDCGPNTGDSESVFYGKEVWLVLTDLPGIEGEHAHVKSDTSIVAIYTSRTILVTQTLRGYPLSA